MTGGFADKKEKGEFRNHHLHWRLRSYWLLAVPLLSNPSCFFRTLDSFQMTHLVGVGDYLDQMDLTNSTIVLKYSLKVLLIDSTLLSSLNEHKLGYKESPAYLK